VTLRARWVTLIARWVMLISRWVTLIFRWVTQLAAVRTGQKAKNRKLQQERAHDREHINSTALRGGRLQRLERLMQQDANQAHRHLLVPDGVPLLEGAAGLLLEQPAVPLEGGSARGDDDDDDDTEAAAAAGACSAVAEEQPGPRYRDEKVANRDTKVWHGATEKWSLNDGQIQNPRARLYMVPPSNFVQRGFGFVHHSIAILCH
jgi:hypothetical protein